MGRAWVCVPEACHAADARPLAFTRHPRAIAVAEPGADIPETAMRRAHWRAPVVSVAF